LPGSVIALDQSRPSGTSFGSPGVARNDLWENRLITCRSTLSGNTSQLWTFIDIPPGSAAILSGASTANATYTPDLPGSYRIQLVTNGGGPGNVQVLIAGVRYDVTGTSVNRGWRVPALGEVKGEDNFSGQTRGWSESIEFILADLLSVIASLGGGGTTILGALNRSLALRGQNGLRTQLLATGTAPPIGGVLTPTTGAQPLGIIYDASTPSASGPSLWVVRRGSGDIARLDLGHSNYISVVVLDDLLLNAQPGDLVFGQGAIWALETTAGSVMKIGIEPPGISKNVGLPEVPAAITFDSAHTLVAATGVASNHLYTIDPVAFTVSAPHSLGSVGDVIGSRTSLLFAQGFYWVCVFNSGSNTGKVLQIDPVLFTTLATYTPGGVGNGLHFFGVTSDSANGKVFFLDTTNTLYRVNVGTLTLDTSLNVGSTPTAMTLGPSNTLWITLGAGSPRNAQQVTGTGGALALGVVVGLANTTTPNGIAFDPVGNNLWVTDSSVDQLMHFASTGGAVTLSSMVGEGSWIGPGTAGYPLASNGAGTLPSYQVLAFAGGGHVGGVLTATHASPATLDVTHQIALCSSSSGTTIANAPNVGLLPGGSVLGWQILVIDNDGVANTNPVTVSGNGQNIEDPNAPGTFSASVVLNASSFAVHWMWNGTHWKII
jgi:hypothetical protein